MGPSSVEDVTSHCRIACALSLQYIKEMLKNVWAFSIAIDSGTNARTVYLDLRIRCYFKDTLQNFHLLAIPIREWPTGEFEYDRIVAALNVIAPEWRHQLIGVTSDGASVMADCVRGICTRLERESHTPIFRIWGGAHQLDLVIEKAFNRLCNSDQFLRTLTGVTGHFESRKHSVTSKESRP
jgi:hypothetical protein